MGRDAVRVILFDDADQLLLVRLSDEELSWWCAPGGGIEDGESDEDTARRELAEEVGLHTVELGPHIWNRRHVGVFRGEPFDQRERYLLGRTARLKPAPADDRPVEHEPGDILWWRPDELLASAEAFAPRRLPALVRSLIDHGSPDEPVDVGV